MPAGRLSRRPRLSPRKRSAPRVCARCQHRFFMLRYVRRLPHWDAIGQPQFVTFRLHGSLPATRGLRREQVATSGEAFVTMDRLLDKGASGLLHPKRPDVAALVVEGLLDSDVRFKRCELHAFVVMPNHVHLLATQFVPLAKWPGPLKGFTANQAKKALRLLTGRLAERKLRSLGAKRRRVSPDSKVYRVESREGGLCPATRAVSLVERRRRLERRLAGKNARPTPPAIVFCRKMYKR